MKRRSRLSISSRGDGRRALGTTLPDKNPGRMAGFETIRVGKEWPSILAIVSKNAANMVHGGEWAGGDNRSAILEFEVEDVDAERARIEAFVTEWIQQPKDMPWGNRSMLFRDPDGKHFIQEDAPAEICDAIQKFDQDRRVLSKTP